MLYVGRTEGEEVVPPQSVRKCGKGFLGRGVIITVEHCRHFGREQSCAKTKFCSPNANSFLFQKHCVSMFTLVQSPFLHPPPKTVSVLKKQIYFSLCTPLFRPHHPCQEPFPCKTNTHCLWKEICGVSVKKWLL